MSAVLPSPQPAAAAVEALESAHVFGAGLLGMVSRPSAAARRTGLILFNAGLVHRVGPFRGHVLLARRLAEEGFAVLRFDQAGLGDSALPATAAADARLAEMRAAMALLHAECGTERFVLAGICSGADDAFALAGEDPRVAGVLAIDGLGYRTPRYWLRHVLARMRPRKLWRLLRRPRGGAGRGVMRSFPPRADSARRLAALVERGVQLLFVYTGGAYGYYNHASQLAAALGAPARHPAVSVQHWPGCDHTFYLRRDRERLGQAVAAWMQACFGAGAAAVPVRRDVAVAGPEGISTA